MSTICCDCFHTLSNECRQNNVVVCLRKLKAAKKKIEEWKSDYSKNYSQIVELSVPPWCWCSRRRGWPADPWPWCQTGGRGKASDAPGCTSTALHNTCVRPSSRAWLLEKRFLTVLWDTKSEQRGSLFQCNYICWQALHWACWSGQSGVRNTNGLEQCQNEK